MTCQNQNYVGSDNNSLIVQDFTIGRDSNSPQLIRHRSIGCPVDTYFSWFSCFLKEHSYSHSGKAAVDLQQVVRKQLHRALNY